MHLGVFIVYFIVFVVYLNVFENIQVYLNVFIMYFNLGEVTGEKVENHVSPTYRVHFIPQS
jgi:hypothetical protein